MPDVTLNHFIRAAYDIAANGDNDTLPFDIDNVFIKDKKEDLAQLAYNYFSELKKKAQKDVKSQMQKNHVFSERLITPTGSSGFRISTKIHPFWNIYFNGLCIAIAERNESNRKTSACSYRFVEKGETIFDKSRSWLAYRKATIQDPKLEEDSNIVVQTDISNFYEHIYHHPLENMVSDLFPEKSTVSIQVNSLLNKFSGNRSFGLPVGGNGSRILAELLMSSVDQMLLESGIAHYRYVDDFIIITEKQDEAYKALSILSNILADYGLSLSKTKTTILSAKHYKDYIKTHIGCTDDKSSKLREIDLHFDPYSETSKEDYDSLKKTIENIDIQSLLEEELKKGQADTFVIAQIGRTLKLQDTKTTLQLCKTLLDKQNLNAFRASWAKIMRGVISVRYNDNYKEIFSDIDVLLDQVIEKSLHLLYPDVNCLYFLKAIKLQKTDLRSKYILEVYNKTNSDTIKSACIECWRNWGDRANFNKIKNKWSAGNLSSEEKRRLWLAASCFGDEGRYFKRSVRNELVSTCKLGIEKNQKNTFISTYINWSENEYKERSTDGC